MGANNTLSYESDAELAVVDLFHGYSEALLQFAHICCILFVLVGIPGNLVTIVALAMCEKFRNSIAYFIISLHVNNLIYCCSVLPMTAANFASRHWTFGLTMCSVYPLIKYVLVGTAHFTVVAITLNRYIIICHPHLYSRFHKKSILIGTLLFTWIMPVIMFLPTFFRVWGKFDLEPIGGNCTIVPDENNSCPKTFFISFAFIGPYLIIITCYTRIWWTVRQAAKRRNVHNTRVVPTIVISRSDCSIGKDHSYLESAVYDNSTSDEMNKLNDSVASTPTSQDSSIVKFFNSATLELTNRSQKPRLPSRKDKKLASMILAILVAFMLCHLPLMATRLYNNYKSNPVLNVLAHLLEYSTAFLSPLIYVLMSREYRQAYTHLYSVIKNKIMN